MSCLNENLPVKYCFFMTGNDPWLKLAMDLHDTGVATPVLWLGDDRHYNHAKEQFGEAVVPMLDFVHRPLKIPKVLYSGEYSEFFESHDYVNAKDKCLKMMDRIDLNGTFSRIDREVYFHKLLIWALKFFYINKPQALLMIENPHSHAQFLIFSVARYLGIPTANFKDCSLIPVNFLQQDDGTYVRRTGSINKALHRRFEFAIDKYVDTVGKLTSQKTTYTPHYIDAQKKNAQLTKRIKSFFGRKGALFFREACSDLKLLYDRSYRATNPFRLLFLSRLLVKIRRQKNLREAILNMVDEVQFDRKYLYFPLHYEPERTTNPDGESYHDQFKVLALLRQFLPKNVRIVVKEHPSQFLMADRGSRGRSPLFYDLVKNIDGVTLAGPSIDSFELIRNSYGVATVTGSVALEAALLGKPALVFGKAWYDGCPNVISWSNVGAYEDFISCASASVGDVRNFLLNLVCEYGVPMINNGGQLNFYREEWYSQEFVLDQHDGMVEVVTEFFDSRVHNEISCQNLPEGKL